MSSRSAPRPHTRHPREHWSSKNRMLIGNSKKGSGAIGRNPNFDTEETKLLIQLWGDPKVQRTLITTHKKHVVILQLASKMRQYGYDRSAEEITTRIKNLKCFYNRLKKDMECSENHIEPTWRHFADMDEIMTRPIFSVRPNEIPAPSLKYQLEQKKEERANRKRKAMEEGRALSESDEDIDDIIAVSNVPTEKTDLSDDGIIPDAEVDMEAADEAFAALVQASPKKRKLSKSTSETSAPPYEQEQEEQDEDENRLLIKEEFENLEPEDEKKLSSKTKSEQKTNSNEKDKEIETQHTQSNNDDTNDSCVALIIPKDEPIDVDAENDNDDSLTKKHSPNMAASLGEMLKLTQNGMVAISSATGNILIPVSSVATTNSTNNAKKLITTFCNNSLATPSSTQALKPGKISLVPTNFLMQSQTLQSSGSAVLNGSSSATKLTMPTQSLQLLKGQMPNRFVLSGTSTVGQTKAPSTGIVTTGPGGMKVLLVNAETAGATGKICMPANLGHNIVGANAAIAKNTIGTVLPNMNAAKSQITNQSSTTTTSSSNATQSLNQQQLQSQQQQPEKSAFKRREEEILARKKRERIAQREELFNRREGTGMRNLLRTLLNVQTHNNEIQRQKVNLERERLEFEKSIAERFFTMLPTLFAQQQQQQQQQQHQQQQPQQQFFNLLQQQPKAQPLRLNPTKLVFATGTPLPSSAIVTPSTSNVVSTYSTSTTTVVNKITNNDAKSNSKIEVNDSPLLTPKVEKEN